MESSCALRKVSLKGFQLYSIPVSLRTVSQETLSNNSWHILKFTLLKFWVLTPLFARPVFLEIMSSTRAWSLQSKLPLILRSLMIYSTLVSTGSNNASSLAGLSNTWASYLSSVGSRSLLDCLQFTVLFSQQISGRLKSPIRMRDCECDDSCSWNMKALSTGSCWCGP